MNYIIAGDTEEHKDVLVYVIAGDRELAEKTLNRMLTNPTPGDLKILKTHTNLRIEETEGGFWNDEYQFLATM